MVVILNIRPSEYKGSRLGIAFPRGRGAVIHESRVMGENVVFRTTVMEGRIIAFAASLVTTQTKADARLAIKVDRLIAELKSDRRSAVRELKAACKTVTAKVFEYQDEHGDTVSVRP